jgi:ATP-dependent DNA ligase
VPLPIRPPFHPMEAHTGQEIPTGPDWQYEPKWDGFRCLAFRTGDSVDLQSKAAKPLTRYFPEVAAAVARVAAQQFVVDGEIVIPQEGGLSFDALLQRIHPADSRIQKLAAQTPGHLILFDLLVDAEGNSLIDTPLKERRKRLEQFARKYLKANKDISLSPATGQLDVAKAWVAESGNALDGIIAKQCSATYQSGEREAMQKIKFMRTADCVVGGFRYGTKSREVGSLLLGLYGDDGLLHHVGFTATGARAGRVELTAKLEALVQPPGFTGRAPGGPSRWSTERSTEWQPLKPELVVEVQYDHLTGGRFRHGTRLLRWRPDKTAAQCTMKQVERESGSPLLLLKR